LNALFLSLLGTPILYYGDEIGMGDNLELDDRYGVRTPMQWSAEKNAGFTEANKTYLPVIDDPVYGYQRLNVAAQEQDEDSPLAWTRYLIRTRQSQPALRAGAREWADTGDNAVLAFRRTEGSNRVLCVFNLSAEARPAGIVPDAELVDLLSRNGRVYPAGVEIQIAPYTALWLLESA